VLVLGKVIDGKLLDVEAEPMFYRETGAMEAPLLSIPRLSESHDAPKKRIA
jgi:hypothetical protein